MPLRQQGLGQLSQKAFEEGGNVIGMKVTGGKVNISSPVELLSQHLLSQAVPRNPKKTLYMQIYRKTTSRNISVSGAARYWKRLTLQCFIFLLYTAI